MILWRSVNPGVEVAMRRFSCTSGRARAASERGAAVGGHRTAVPRPGCASLPLHLQVAWDQVAGQARLPPLELGKARRRMRRRRWGICAGCPRGRRQSRVCTTQVRGSSGLHERAVRGAAGSREGDCDARLGVSETNKFDAGAQTLRQRSANPRRLQLRDRPRHQ